MLGKERNGKIMLSATVFNLFASIFATMSDSDWTLLASSADQFASMAASGWTLLASSTDHFAPMIDSGRTTFGEQYYAIRVSLHHDNYN